MSLFDWSLRQFQIFILILMRVSPILFLMPLLGSRSIPNLVKIGLCLVISLALLPILAVDARRTPEHPGGFVLFLFSEVLLGFLLGLSVKLILTGLQVAGEFAGYQMGLAMANLFDPQSGMDTTLVAQFFHLLGLLLFLAVDGHHWFFRAMMESFRLIAPGGMHVSPGLYQHLLGLSGKMFIIAVKLAAPVMAVLLFVQIALGLVAKTVPQVNILVTSFPLTICLGLLFLALSADLMGAYVRSLLDEAGRSLVYRLLPLMGK